MAELTYTQRLFSRQVEQTARERQAFEKEKQRFAKSYADGRKVDRYGRTCCNSAASMDPQAQAQQPPPADDLDDEDLRMMAGYMDGTVTDQEYASTSPKNSPNAEAEPPNTPSGLLKSRPPPRTGGESFTSCECYTAVLGKNSARCLVRPPNEGNRRRSRDIAAAPPIPAKP